VFFFCHSPALPEESEDCAVFSTTLVIKGISLSPFMAPRHCRRTGFASLVSGCQQESRSAPTLFFPPSYVAERNRRMASVSTSPRRVRSFFLSSIRSFSFPSGSRDIKSMFFDVARWKFDPFSTITSVGLDPSPTCRRIPAPAFFSSRVDYLPEDRETSLPSIFS